MIGFPIIVVGDIMDTIYEDLQFDDYDEQCIIFDELFNNEWEEKLYIITGDIGLWDGVRKDVHHPHIFKSLKDAILTANDDFDGYITVSEGKYGKLWIDICHHDGNNHLEVREITNVGRRMITKQKTVSDIINRKGATKNVKFLKNYGC